MPPAITLASADPLKISTASATGALSRPLLNHAV